MHTDFSLPLYYWTGVYGLVVGLVSFYNFWRAPPPVGHRNLLLASIGLFSAGAAADGGEKLGLLPEFFGILGEVLLLMSMVLLLYVSYKIYRRAQRVREP